MAYVLEFERPVVEIEEKIAELTSLGEGSEAGIGDEIKALKKKAHGLRREIFSSLDPWQRIQLARHPERPYTLDYVRRLIDGWVEIHGDRAYADDQAIVCGFGEFRGIPVAVMGHQKGRTAEEKVKHNYGSPHPEGYRKALRVMRLADRFGLPILSFLDTAGAYPGIGAEERGQAEAIARNVEEMFRLSVPFIAVVIGEGGSGGAFGIGVGNKLLIQEYAYYSVISPEGCAAILWRDRAEAPRAAAALRVTPDELFKLKIADEIIPEPEFGAHRDYDGAAKLVGDAVERHLREILDVSPDGLMQGRREKFLAMGEYIEGGTIKGGRFGDGRPFEAS
jgi:acetyl-CoA carboxylase carboxyl transferase subunit alpha